MPEDTEMPAAEEENAAKNKVAVDNGEKGGGDDEAEKEVEKPAEPEEPKELEQDDEADKRPKLEAPVTVDSSSSTLNVVPTCGGKVLMALSDGGLQYMTAAARATAGIKSGRYLFEVRIAEKRLPAERPKQRADPGCKLGFTIGGASLFIGEGETDNVGFDSTGSFWAGNQKTSVCGEFVPCNEVYGVLLNLDPKSANANTVSLFRDGERMCQPQPLPESMKGKVLYPTINYRSMTLHMNFGPTIWHPLPFKCKMLQVAAKSDVEVVPLTKPKDGKHEVLFPVGLPDEGTFDWLDGFLEENKNYTEISTRANLEWGLKSGLWRKNGSWRSCNDEPSLEFGIREVDGYTLPQMIQAVTPVQKRNYVAMEVKKNLSADARKRLLAQFNGQTYKKVAVVVMGEPPAKFKANVHDGILLTKKKKVAEEVKRARQEADRKKKAEVAKQKKDKEEKGKKSDVAMEDEEKEAEDGEKDEEKAVEPAEEKEVDKEAEEKSLQEEIKKAEAAVELSEQEKAICFKKSEVEDLDSKDFSRLFSTFTIPDESEGFDEIRYVWQKAPACQDYLKKWILERKMTQRVEDLQPGSWFRDQLGEWNALIAEWRKRHSDWKDPVRRKHVLKSKRDEKDRKKKEEKASAQPTDENTEETNGSDKKEQEDDPMEEKKTEDGDGAKKGEEDSKEADGEAQADKDEVEDKADDEMDINVAELDVFSVKDVCDVGTGEPLFANFTWEDWMALSLRFELHLLAHGYRRDMDDPERSSFHESHLDFYYNKYFKKQLTFKSFGVETALELLAITKDTMEVVPKTSVLDPQLSDDTPFENFVKLTEDHRRERQKMLDAGDETVALKFQKPAPRGQPQSYQQAGGGRHGASAPASHSRGPAPPGASRYGPPAAGSRSDSRAAPGGYSSRPSSANAVQPLGRGAPSGYAAPPPGRGAPSGYAPPPPGRAAPSGYAAPPPGRGAPSGYAAPPPPGRGYAAPPPGRGAPPAPSHYSRDAPRSGGEKRAYPPPPSSSHRADSRDHRDKQPRTSSHSGGAPPPPSRGGSYGGGSYGGSRR